MRKTHVYEKYEDYIEHQKEKTTDPRRRHKWLNEEWSLKLNGFAEIFSSLGGVLENGQRALCIGARTGQEVVALRQLGIDAVGIDIVPHEDLVVEGDMHNLQFEDSSFDFVFSNVFDHSISPEKKISEIERVLKVDGHCLIQFQIKIPSDDYSENEIDSIDHDVLSLFEQSNTVHSNLISRNFAGMNWEILMKKDEVLSSLYHKVGRISDLSVPTKYKQIWEEINLPTQIQKGQSYQLEEGYLNKCLEGLHRRAFYLTRIAEFVGAKNIAEVGTAQGWQYYSFAEYASKNSGHVWSCDIQDVRNHGYAEKYKESTTFILGTSHTLAETLEEQKQKIDMFYIDGSHQAKAVLTDIGNLRHLQSDNCVWVFDDFDLRFGCYREIQMLRGVNNRYKIYRVGDAASGNPNHQVVIFGKL
jgi:ubiquinone/menaquinone biosynthesis C-methylase UbiE